MNFYLSNNIELIITNKIFLFEKKLNKIWKILPLLLLIKKDLFLFNKYFFELLNYFYIMLKNN